MQIILNEGSKEDSSTLFEAEITRKVLVKTRNKCLNIYVIK